MDTGNAGFRWTWRLAMVMATLHMFAARAHAGAIAPCSDPFVYNGAAVNVVVLPYAYTLAPGQQFRDMGEKLAALVQADTLYSILKFDSIGVVRLYGQAGQPGQPSECDPQRILKKLLTPGSFDWTMQSPGASSKDPARNALILVWGSIYEEGDDIFVQTFMQFRRRDKADPGENVYYPLGGEQPVSFTSEYLSGRLAAQSFAFEPRRITVQDLSRIAEKFSTSAVLRASPDENSQKVIALVGNQNMPTQSWSVLEQKGDWIRLQVSMVPGVANVVSGWLHARIDLGDTPLAKVLPEMHYIEGLVGYLRCRILGGTPAMTSASLSALDAYMKAEQEDQEPLPAAVNLQVQGFLHLLATKQSREGLGDAEKLFALAFEKIPYSGEAGNLEMITRVFRSFQAGAQPVGSKTFTSEMLQLSALDPANKQVLFNLGAMYSYSKRPDILARVPVEEQLTSPELASKINALRLDNQAVWAAHPLSDWPGKKMIM